MNKKRNNHSWFLPVILLTMSASMVLIIYGTVRFVDQVEKYGLKNIVQEVWNGKPEKSNAAD